MPLSIWHRHYKPTNISTSPILEKKIFVQLERFNLMQADILRQLYVVVTWQKSCVLHPSNRKHYCTAVALATLVNQRLPEGAIGQHQADPRLQIQNKVPQRPVMTDLVSTLCPLFDMPLPRGFIFTHYQCNLSMTIKPTRTGSLLLFTVGYFAECFRCNQQRSGLDINF